MLTLQIALTKSGISMFSGSRIVEKLQAMVEVGQKTRACGYAEELAPIVIGRAIDSHIYF